jgi:hypothetical protein
VVLPASGVIDPAPVDGLEELLRREGWGLHQRLQVAPQHAATGASAGAGAALQRWRELVGPDQPLNFEKRLRWDGLTEVNLGWALDPPAEATPLEANWWPLLQELRQAARLAAADPGPPLLAECGKDQPFVHVWRPGEEGSGRGFRGGAGRRGWRCSARKRSGGYALIIRDCARNNSINIPMVAKWSWSNYTRHAPATAGAFYFYNNTKHSRKAHSIPGTIARLAVDS